MKPTISVIVPALNEEDNIEPAVNEVISALDGRFSDYELLVFDDGSTDNTGAIIDRLAANDKNVRAIHNENNMGLGYSYKKGVQLAKNDYIVMFPGDNQILKDSMTRIFDMIGRADIVIPYIENYRVRPLSRQLISKSFTTVMNLLFRLNLHYYNGTVIHKREIIQPMPIDTDGFAYQAEILTKLIKSGHGYVEVGVPICERACGFSKAFYLKNIGRVCWSIVSLFWEFQFKGRGADYKPVQKSDAAR